MPLNAQFVQFGGEIGNLQLRQILTDLTANDAVYTRSHQSEWIAMTMMLSELEQCACACALPGPRQVDQAGGDRGVRAHADRSLIHCDTQVLLSGFPDFQQNDGK